MVVGQDLQQLPDNSRRKLTFKWESLKITKSHQKWLRRVRIDRSRRGEAGGPNESSRGPWLARLLTSPQFEVNSQIEVRTQWSLSLNIPKNY